MRRRGFISAARSRRRRRAPRRSACRSSRRPAAANPVCLRGGGVPATADIRSRRHHQNQRRNPDLTEVTCHVVGRQLQRYEAAVGMPRHRHGIEAQLPRQSVRVSRELRVGDEVPLGPAGAPVQSLVVVRQPHDISQPIQPRVVTAVIYAWAPVHDEAGNSVTHGPVEQRGPIHGRRGHTGTPSPQAFQTLDTASRQLGAAPRP